jgi:sigma-B regulation protein RsbU (phosphoserine phosphatase)
VTTPDPLLVRAQREATLAARQLAESWEEINLLYSIGEILGRTVSLSEAATTILSEISETVGAGLGAIYTVDVARGVLVPVATIGADLESLPAIGIDVETSVAARVYRTHHPLLAPAGELDGAKEKAVRRGAMLCVPVLGASSQGSVPLGVLSLSGRRSGDFTAGDQKLVAAIATQIGTAIQIDRLVRASMEQGRLAHEMQLAHDLQMRLLPDTDSVAPALCAARVEPAQSVGGDFYHLFKKSDGRIGVLIGDVSSHGYRAALIMALTMSAMAIHAQASDDPGETIGKLLQSLEGELQETEMFLSLCYAVVDPLHATMHYTNTGHPHAFVMTADGTAERLLATDPPLGLGSQPPHAATHSWHTGDSLLVLFTDGIADARDAAGAVLGESRVLDVIRARRKDAPSRIVDGVFALVEGHMGAVPALDDQAIVILRA